MRINIALRDIKTQNEELVPMMSIKQTHASFPSMELCVSFIFVEFSSYLLPTRKINEEYCEHWRRQVYLTQWRRRFLQKTSHSRSSLHSTSTCARDTSSMKYLRHCECFIFQYYCYKFEISLFLCSMLDLTTLFNVCVPNRGFLCTAVCFVFEGFKVWFSGSWNEYDILNRCVILLCKVLPTM